MAPRTPRVHRRPGTRKKPVHRWCQSCERVTPFTRRVRPNGHLQHDCRECQRRRDKRNHTLTYNTWRAMWDRCTNPNVWNHKYYGGRGVTICERWESFEAFVEDMGERPSRDLTLDRIDVEKGYGPDNCRWADWSEQQRNKRRPDANADTFAYFLAHNRAEAERKGLE